MLKMKEYGHEKSYIKKRFAESVCRIGRIQYYSGKGSLGGSGTV
jgi:hypothetical protein